MEQKVLLAYATRLGSSRETAGFIADVLRENGLSVDLQPVADVASLEQYGPVVLVAALYIGRLHRDARAFLSRQRRELERRPVALFVPGPADGEEKSWAGARKQLDERLAQYPWLHPVAKHVIGGAWDPATMSYPWKFLLRKAPKSDARDWNAIRGLALEVAAALKPAEVTGR